MPLNVIFVCASRTNNVYNVPNILILESFVRIFDIFGRKNGYRIHFSNRVVFPRTYDVASKNVYLILWETISVDFISPHHIVVNATCVRQ